MGVEKLVLKSDKMIGYFISNPQSPFYESIKFTKLLDYIQKNPNKAKLSEKNDRLRIIYQNVGSLNKAFHLFEEILN